MQITIIPNNINEETGISRNIIKTKTKKTIVTNTNKQHNTAKKNNNDNVKGKQLCE